MAFGRLGGSFGRVGQWAGGGGVYVWPPHNLIVSSKDASVSNSTANVTITANTTAGPFADVTADTLAFAGSNSAYHYKATSVAGINGQTYCGSIYLKAAAPVPIGVWMSSSDNSGTQGVAVWSVTTAWQRFNVSCISGSSVQVINIGLDPRSFVSGDNGAAKTVIAADWQINRGTIPTAYVAT